MFEKSILKVYSVIAGAFLIISGLGKVANSAGFADLIDQYGFGSLRLLAPVIALSELLLGLLLVLLVDPKRSSLLGVVLLATLTCSFAYAHFKNGVNDCGCFGTFLPSGMPPLASFTRNTILILMLLVVCVKYPGSQFQSARWHHIAVVAIMIPAVFVSGLTLRVAAAAPDGTRSRHPYSLKDIRDTALSKHVSATADSTYLIFCFSYTCPHCWDSMENLVQYKQSNTVQRIVALAIGRDNDRKAFSEAFHLPLSVTELPQDAMNELTNVFPTAFYVERDTVRVVMRGTLPSAMTFRRYLLPSGRGGKQL